MTVPPQLDSAAPTNGAPKLRRSMGLWMATALVVGNMVGSGIFLLPATLAGTTARSRCSAGCSPAPVRSCWHSCSPTSAARFRGRAALTPMPSARSATSSASRPPGATGSRSGPGTRRSHGLVSYLTVFWPGVGEDNLLGALVGIALIWLLTATNILGARDGGIVQLATTILKFVPLAVIGLVGLFFIDGGNYEPFSPNGASLSLLSTTAALTLWAFIEARVERRAGRRGQGPRAHDPARHDPRHRPGHGALPRRHRRDHGHHPDRPAGGLDVAVRGRGRRGVRRRLWTR